MPSSPYQSTLDAPSEDDHDHEHEHENDQQQQNVLNDEISKMINMSPFKSSPNRANRLDTGNLIMSNQNKDDDKRIKHQLQIQNSILMMMMKVNIMKDIKILQKWSFNLGEGKSISLTTLNSYFVNVKYKPKYK